jgi:hypothetical protein
VADASDFDEVVDALYALPPAEFVAAREERAKAARSAGDRGLAARIHALRRPTLGAWMVNLLAHERPELLRQLVELGRELREAQEGLRGEDLRTLNSQRQQVVAALVGEARTLARAEGERASDEAAYEVERTLLAALADPKAGEEVTTGTLVHPLDYAGFGPVGSADVGSAGMGSAGMGSAGMVRPDARPRRVRRGDRPARAPAGPASDNDLTAARRRRERAEAEAALRAAETEQRQAATRAKRSAERATDAESRRQEADAEIGRLSRELHAAQSVAAAAQELERHARTKATEAAVEAEEAAERHAEARRRLDELPRAEP